MAGGGIVAEEFVIAEICERFGWTWEEYYSQPAHFLETIKEKMKVEQEVQAEKEREARKGQ